ncbi:MAG TPA: hypothetical protein VGK58_00870 [Lacipirellulaceae bacterium]
MLRRIVRSLATFIAIFAVYQAYARVAVPWMEPPLKATRRHVPTTADMNDAAQAASQYQLLLSNYFPKDHWSQTRPPKVITSADETGMLVVDDWKPLDTKPKVEDDGRLPARVAINRFAVLYFPTPPREGILPPRDAVILEAPQGARLDFADFRPERWQIGEVTGGQFPGRIIIRSDMREPGPEDDLYLETADLEMNSKLLQTDQPVRFRLGPNAGVGRELELRFLAEEHVRPKEFGLKLPTADSLEIRRDVRLRLQLDTGSLLPSENEPSPSPARQGSPQASPKGRGMTAANPPVEVTCSGPFVFDFVRPYRASLDRDVELRQLNPAGPSDQLTCNQLDLYFSPKPAAGGAVEPIVSEPRRRQQRDLLRLEPAMLIAEGHPVVIISPARRAEARGERIQIGLREKRVQISGGDDVILRYGPNVLRAPFIDYQHPSGETGTSLGRFRARGPGSLEYRPDPTKPMQFVHAAWQQSIELGREHGQPVLVMNGRPGLMMADAGGLVADRIKLSMRELEAATAASGVGLPIAQGSKSKGKVRLAPDQLTASGGVEIQSSQLVGRTEELITTFRLQPDAPPAAAARSQSTGGVTGQLTAAPQPGASRQSFHVDAERMRFEVIMRGQSISPSSAVCAGKVVLREIQAANASEQPLEIRGGQLTIDQLESGTAHIVLTGAGPGEPPGSKKAQLTGRGTTVLTEVVELDQRGNRLWSNGPGEATLILTRGLDARAPQSPIPVDVSWRGGLQFDGQNVLIQKNVVVAGVDDTLHCDELSAKLTVPIQFGQSVGQRTVDVAEMECRGRVSIDHRSRDDVGVTSHERVQLERLQINQRTGAISGDGPGVIRSTRFGAGLATLTGPQAGASQQRVADPQTSKGSKLHFLRLDFQRGLTGDMYYRTLSFDGRVRTVYGPVDAWEQELDASRPETLPPDSVLLSCDQLRINEDPIAATAAPIAREAQTRPLGPVQLEAKGNVHIDGQTESQGIFGALADRATYEEIKDVFVLEGGTRNPAQLWLRRYPGEQVTPLSAGRIRYDRSTGLPKVERFQNFEITPGNLEKAERPGSVPR